MHVRSASSLVLSFICVVVFSVGRLEALAQTPTAASANAPIGQIRGTVVDSSSAVLPGVVVTASAADGRPFGTEVTDANGNYSFSNLHDGVVTLTFHLDGFVNAATKVTVRAGSPVDPPLVQTLDIAALAEVVTVRAEPPPPPPPPPPVTLPVPDHDETAVCAPAKAESPVPAFGVLLGSRKDPRQNLYASGDEVVIDIGTLNGLTVGQNFVVRRRFPTQLMDGPKAPVVGEHSSGLVQIVSVADQKASAVVIYACDAMMTGDYLALFNPEPRPMPEPSGDPAYEKAARILFGDAGETLSMTNRMVVIGHGNQHGVRTGQQVTLFRRASYGPTVLGRGVVVAVRRGSATVHVQQASDVIYFGRDGDWAAIEHNPQMGKR